MAKIFFKKKNKHMRSIVLFLFILISGSLFAQEKTAIITYKGMINEKYVDSFLTDIKKKDIPMSIKQSVVDMYENATPDLFILEIKGEESFYHYDPALNVDGEYNIGSKAGKNPYYTNNKSGLILESSSVLGKISHEPLKWKITKQTKKVGKFTCYKAVATERLYSRQGYYYNREVIAWFTPQIPLNYGPKYYKGLPGLVLEINTNKFIITAIKLNLNPESKKINIKDFSEKGTIISQEEAYARIHEIMEDRKKK